MIRKVSVLMILLFLGIFIPFVEFAEDKTVMRIAGDENYPPYEFVDANGVYKGFNVDIMKAISRDQKVNIELVPMAWDNALQALEDNKVDAVQGMTRSSNRSKKYSFSEALVINSQAIFVRSETYNITALEDLEGMTVATQAGDVSEEFVRKIPGVVMVSYNNQEQAMEALLQKDVNAFVGNRLTGLYIIQNMKQYNKIKIVGELLYPTQYCSAALKENEEVLALINKGISDLKKSGEYNAIYNKWFGEAVVDRSMPFRRILLAVSIVLTAAIVVILLIFYWNKSLKKSVDFKTMELEKANRELKDKHRLLQQTNRLQLKI